MILLICNNLTDMLTQYGNTVQYDQGAGPLLLLYFINILNEHKKIFLYQSGV